MKKRVRSISFPKSEIPRLSKQSKIITTRISAEKGKYKPGDCVKAPWGKTFLVTMVESFTELADHPFFDELTKAWKTEIGDNPFDVVFLEKKACGRKEASSMAKRKLAKSKIRKILLEEAGAVRISADSVPTGEKVAVNVLHQLGARAASIARSYGRRTIMPEDILAACRQIVGGDACERISGEEDED